jgi:GT2 family glycosyltransferase
VSTNAPAVSVVVATHNRVGLLDRLVVALQSQVGAPTFEVVIVDDASTDDTPAALDRIQREWPAVRALRLDHNQGPAAARNAGWRAATAPIVAFTDDDCIPQPGWLAALATGFERGDIVQGRTGGNPTQPRIGYFAWAPETTGANGFFETCNIAYRRTLLDKVDGFDETFRSVPRRARARRQYIAPAWGEDTDLALRARVAGGRTAFADEAVVWHDMKAGGLSDRLRDLPRRAGVVAVVKRHPELRQSFDSPLFSQRGHAYVLAVAAGVAIVARRPRAPSSWLAASILASPWVRERGRHYPRHLWPRVLPQWFLVDLVDVGVMAAASVRHRALFL